MREDKDRKIRLIDRTCDFADTSFYFNVFCQNFLKEHAAFVVSSTNLTSYSVRTELPKTQGRRYLPQQRHHVEMLNSSFRVGIVFGPQSNKLIQVMRSEDRPVSRQVVKVVHDNGDEEVDDLFAG